MPALTDVRLELFALGLAQDLGKYAAYKRAGYKGSAPACSVLLRKPQLHARVAELRREISAALVAERGVERVVANREWALGKLQGIVETPAAGAPRVADHVAAIDKMARLAGWESGTGEPRRMAVEPGEVRQLTPAEVRRRWAEGIEEAAAHFGTDSVQELVARMREAEEAEP